jgi:hypothetical protein
MTCVVRNEQHFAQLPSARQVSNSQLSIGNLHPQMLHPHPPS